MFKRKPKPTTPRIPSVDPEWLRAAEAAKDGPATAADFADEIRGTHRCLTLTVNNHGAMALRTHLPAEQVAGILRDAADQYAAETGAFRESPEAERLSAILRLVTGRPGDHTVTVKDILSAGISDDEQGPGGERA